MNENPIKETKEIVLRLHSQGNSIKEIATLANVPGFWVEIIIKEAFKKEMVLRLHSQGNSIKEIATLLNVPGFRVENVIKEDR